MKKTLFSLALMMLCLMSACKGGDSDAPLMQIDIDPAVSSKIVVEYSPYNDRLDSRFIDIEPDSTGKALFTAGLPEGIKNFDAKLMVDRQEFNVHLIKGETLAVTITPSANGVAVTYSGKGAAVSNLLTTMTEGFNLRRFFEHGPDSLPPLDVMVADIDSVRRQLDASVGAIDNDADREYYAHYLDRHVVMLKELVMRVHCNVNNICCDSLPEYVALVNTSKPDDEADVRTGFYQSWLELNNHVPHPYSTDYMIENLRLIDSVMTTPVSRHIAFNSVAVHYLTGNIQKDEMKRFYEAFTQYAAEFPELVSKTEAKVQELMLTVCDGEKLPYDPQLETPEGDTVMLSELYGKVLYIDFWATWCGPCCGEIPYMEKLYEQMKGNKNLELISISVDEDREAWLNKIAADKPGWKQFRLPDEENQKLSKALNITGIPRFVVIGSDGKFISTFAPRPSDSETADMLQSLTRQQDYI